MPALTPFIVGALGGFDQNARNTLRKVYPSYKRFHDAVKKEGLDTVDIEKYLTTLYTYDDIDYKTLKDAVNLLDKFENSYSEDEKGMFENMTDAFLHGTMSGKDAEAAAKLYDALYKGLSTYDNLDDMSLEDILNRIESGVGADAPTIASVPGPTYNVVRTGDMASMPVGDVPLWTGQELADLNKTNWDPNHYYEALKKGTQAAVARDQFGVEQMDQASRALNTRQQASYLDSIRKAKSEAIAAGATRGARAANEMLATQENIKDYADTQAEVKQTNYDSMLNSLLADASAKVTAREYFDNLANTRYNEAIQFYINDTDAQGQELLTDAELYNADLQDRAQAVYSNALMDQYYNQAAAQVDVANNGINSVANEYAWLFKTFAQANDGDLPKTKSDIDSYIFNRYTGKNNVKDFLNSIDKK